MDKKPASRAYVFLIGFVLVVVGFGLMLWTTGCVTEFPALCPLLATIAGGIMIFFADSRKAAFPIVFCGYFIALSGIFSVFVLSNRWEIADWWPLVVLAIGFAVLPSGLHRYRKLKASFFAPAISFVLLGTLFSFFSFGLVPLTFKDAFNFFWPILLVVFGVILISMYVYNRIVFNKPKKERK